MNEIVYFLFILCGLVSGLLGGMLGVGGGLITVPFLYYYFVGSGLFQNDSMHMAIGTSLAAAFVTSAISTLVQARKKTIQKRVVQWMAPGILVGSVGGSLLAHFLKGHALSTIFGIVALPLGASFFFSRFPQLKIAASPNQTLSIFAVLIGAFSSLLGIGGGSIAFPVLLGYNMPIKEASATSAISTCISSGIGAAAYLAISWGKQTGAMTFGYIYIPAWLLFSAASFLAAPLGVKLSHSLEVNIIKRIFGACLFIIGLSMLNSK